MRRFVLLLPILLPFSAPAAFGSTTLWNQGDADGGFGWVNQEFPGYMSYSTYIVNDVHVPAGGWTIQSISSVYTFVNLDWTAPTIPVVLNIFPKSGLLPDSQFDPRNGNRLAATLAQDSSCTFCRRLEIEGLYMYLAEGDWWVGLTPSAGHPPFPDFYSGISIDRIWTFNTHYQAGWNGGDGLGAWGDQSAIRNPGGEYPYFGKYYGTGGDSGWRTVGYQLDSGPDFNILILGDAGDTTGVPEPGTLWMAGVGALALCRRRYLNKGDRSHSSWS